MERRYLPSDAPRPPSIGDTEGYLAAALDDIVASCPPRSRYAPEALHGLWSGPTGIAYLLLQVAARRPGLEVGGAPAAVWARRYLADGSRGHSLRLGSHGCGVADERLAYDAVRAAATGDLDAVRRLAAAAAQVAAVEDYPDELLYGRAGTLYLLRMVRRLVPGSAALVDPAVAEIADTVLARGPRWRWHGRRYLGAVHGDVGIATQLVLTSPELAPRLRPVVEALLARQRPDGNWPSSEESGAGRGLVQFCHGAPGFVHSLLSLRPHYPDLRDRIDAAVDAGRRCIAAQGLLTKEPSLCHGIFGNALALAAPQRERFLAVATPDNVARVKAAHPGVFARADYGRPYSACTSYAPSAVWAWLVWRDDEPGVMGYNDV